MTLATFCCAALAHAIPVIASDSSITQILDSERRRVELIERISPAVVCVFTKDQEGSGSGVLIDPNGYGLTNYHVVAGMLNSGEGLGGLLDGKLYALQVLGVDPTGDVAMFRLSGRDRFPYVPLGDSDSVQVGDTAIAMGNPFSISEDYTPTVTMGMVTGVHRYQWGQGNNLVYSDCIQVDTSINPGNSGGPLFDDHGEVIGINGRISVGKRGRYNVGFAYAIASNQIKRFMPSLRGGLLARHGTLQAKVADSEAGHVTFTDLISYAAAHRAGIRVGDRLISVDGILIDSANHLTSLLGTYPENWELPLAFERDDRRLYTVARMDPISPKLRRPFVPDATVNADVVDRLVAAIRRRYVRPASVDSSLRWSVSRRPTRDSGNYSHLSYCFEAFHMEGGPIYLESISSDSAWALAFDQRHASRHSSLNTEPASLPPDQAAALRMIAWTLRLLHSAEDHVYLAGAEFVGGTSIFVDSFEDPSGMELPSTERLKGIAVNTVSLLCPIDDALSVEMAINEETGEIVRLTARSVESEVVVEFGDFDRSLGFDVPYEINVRAREWGYQATWSDWERF